MSEVVISPQYTPWPSYLTIMLGHHTDHGRLGLGQYNSHGEYCNPHTALYVFLILVSYLPQRMFHELDYLKIYKLFVRRLLTLESEFLMSLLGQGAGNP